MLHRPIPSANCTKRKLQTAKQFYSDMVNHKRNENEVVGIERLNFLMVNKSVTAEVK